MFRGGHSGRKYAAGHFRRAETLGGNRTEPQAGGRFEKSGLLAEVSGDRASRRRAWPCLVRQGPVRLQHLTGQVKAPADRAEAGRPDGHDDREDRRSARQPCLTATRPPVGGAS
jgi:hypothetical protein